MTDIFGRVKNAKQDHELEELRAALREMKTRLDTMDLEISTLRCETSLARGKALIANAKAAHAQSQLDFLFDFNKMLLAILKEEAEATTTAATPQHAGGNTDD